MTVLYLGTGGFSNDDWVGIFYPPTLKKTEWLPHYAQHFNAVEVNSTFYAVPGQKTFASMVERTEGKLEFSVKLHQSFTHTLDADREAAGRFRFTVEPAREAGVLGPLLAQFPYSFKNTQDAREHLKNLAEWFEAGRGGPEIAVEFRHESWDRDAVHQYLHDVGLEAVSVDLPRLQGLPEAALHRGAYAYLRLHGRNAKNWWDGKDAAARHDYTYTEAELELWVNALRRAAVERAYVFFQNTTRGQGLENARQFRALWDAETGA